MTTHASSSALGAKATEELEDLAALPAMIRLTALCFITTALGWISGAVSSLGWLPWLFYSIAFVSGGWYTVQAAWDSLKQREFDVNFLMLVAALGAAAVGQPREGAILMFLFALSNTLETYAMGRTHQAVNALLEMAPDQASRIEPDGSTKIVPVAELNVGELVRVRPGENVPIDGIVLKGESAINEAAITGESIPAEKRTGSAVFAGTLNGQGTLDIKVRTAPGDTTLARIVATVEEAREQKALAQDFTDRVIGQYYAYAVVVMTLLAIAIPLLFLDWDTQTTLYRAMALMVVASPCALVISIPAAMLSAMANAARQGILFKGGMHIEAASTIKVIALDKTGTLTTGKPGITVIEAAEGYTAEQVLAAAAAVEHLSEHPLAQAVVRGAQERGVAIQEASSFKALTGVGAEALVNGQLMRIGRPSLFGETLATRAHELEQEGRTVIAIGTDHIWGLIGLEDTVRTESRAAIEQLHAAGIEKIVLLTGDNRYVAQRLADQLGIDTVHAELLPQDKARIISELQQEIGPVAMIGDGINDAPALATARLGIAMGVAGTDVALQSADMLLMSDDLLKVAQALHLSRRARRIITQNIIFSSLVIISLVISALFGNVTLPLGVVGHEGSTLLVVANGLRLLRNPKIKA